MSGKKTQATIPTSNEKVAGTPSAILMPATASGSRQSLRIKARTESAQKGESKAQQANVVSQLQSQFDDAANPEKAPRKRRRSKTKHGEGQAPRRGRL